MKNIIIAAAVLIVLAIGGWYTWTTMQTKTPETKSTSTEMEAKDEVKPTSDEKKETTSKKSTLADLLSVGGNQKCTYTYATADVTNSGTVYISDDKMRSDYDMTASDTTNAGSMIRDGNTFYMWGSNMPQGVKMEFDIEKFKDMNSTNGQNAQTQIDPNMEVDYKCDSWSADQGIFTPPSDVTFTDMSAMMKTMPTQSENPQDNCALCDKLNGDAKASCLTSFKCE